MLRYRDGDTAAFETLYQRYEKPLFDFIYRMAPNAADSESLFQETFFRVVRAKDRYRATALFKTWLFHIAVNLCRDFPEAKAAVISRIAFPIPPCRWISHSKPRSSNPPSRGLSGPCRRTSALSSS